MEGRKFCIYIYENLKLVFFNSQQFKTSTKLTPHPHRWPSDKSNTVLFFEKSIILNKKPSKQYVCWEWTEKLSAKSDPSLWLLLKYKKIAKKHSINRYWSRNFYVFFSKNIAIENFITILEKIRLHRIIPTKFRNIPKFSRNFYIISMILRRS